VQSLDGIAANIQYAMLALQQTPSDTVLNPAFYVFWHDKMTNITFRDFSLNVSDLRHNEHVSSKCL